MRSAATRDRTALTVGIFAVAYGTNVSTPFLVEYRRLLDLGQSATVGIFVVYVVGILGALLVGGPLSDRFGRRPVVLPATLLSACASMVLVFGRDSFALLLAGRFLLGVVSGAVLGVGAAWLLELYGPGDEQRSAVRTTVVSFAGFGIGPLISAVVFEVGPAPLVSPFLVHTGFTLFVLAAMLSIPETRPPNSAARLLASTGVPADAVRPFRLVIVPAAVWVFAFPSTGFALFPVLVSESIEGSDVIVAAVAGALTAWAGLVSRPIVARVGPQRALPIGLVIGVMGYVAGTVAFTADLWPFVLLAAPLLGAAAGTLTVGCLTLVGIMATDERRGALTSSFYLLAYPGMAMPLLITTLAALGSMTVALVAVTVTASLCTIAAAIVSRGVPIEAERPQRHRRRCAQM